MEAARQGLGFSIRRLPLRRPDSGAGELEQLRPLGEAFLLRRFSGSIGRADAEDAVSDVVIRLQRRIESGRAPDNLRAAFFTSVRNAAIDQLRSRAAKPTVALDLVADAPAEAPTPLEAAEGREASIRLQEALGRMRPNYREAILLRFGVGLTVPEIAERLHISLPAAKKLVLRSTAQIRKRIAAIEGEEFCPEMRELARRSLLDKQLAGLASESEQRVLHAHFQHCGSCKSFLTDLHRGLHELGGSALLAGAAGTDLNGHLGVADRLGNWLGQATDGAQGLAGKTRLAAYKASGAFQASEATTAGALSGTAQKIAAVCGAATATTATCLATGIVGPGIGATGVDHSQASADRTAPAPVVRSLGEQPAPTILPASAEAEASPPAPEPQPQSTPESAPTQSQPAQSAPPPEPATEEFGFEADSPSAEPAPAPKPAPAPSPAPTPSGGGGGGSGGESFGFGG